MSTIAQELKVAVSRYQITGGLKFDEFINKIEKEVKFASANKADFILLPELITLDLFQINPSNVKKNIKKTITHTKNYEKSLKKLASKYSIVILGGSQFVEIKNKIINRAYIVFPDGKLKTQDKNYVTPWEKSYKISNGKSIKSFVYKDVSFSLIICHDIEFPSISQKLAKTKPEILFVTSQTDTTEGLHRVMFTSQARAIEHMSYVVLSGNTGKKNAKWHSYVGGAHLFHPINKYFPSNTNKSFVGIGKPKFFNLDIKKLRKSRKDSKQVYPIRDHTSLPK